MRYSISRPTEFAVRADEDGGKHITGYFSVFGDTYHITDRITESIDRRAFDESPNKDVRALVNHDTTLVLGRTTAGTLNLMTDERGLYGDILINEDDQDAMNLYRRVQRGDVSQCSFGFEILKEREEHDKETGNIHYTIESVNLFEVSCVTFPAYEKTSIQAREHDAEALIIREHEAWKTKAVTRLRGAEKYVETAENEKATDGQSQ